MSNSNNCNRLMTAMKFSFPLLDVSLWLANDNRRDCFLVPLRQEVKKVFKVITLKVICCSSYESEFYLHEISADLLEDLYKFASIALENSCHQHQPLWINEILDFYSHHHAFLDPEELISLFCETKTLYPIHHLILSEFDLHRGSVAHFLQNELKDKDIVFHKSFLTWDLKTNLALLLHSLVVIQLKVGKETPIIEMNPSKGLFQKMRRRDLPRKASVVLLVEGDSRHYYLDPEPSILKHKMLVKILSLLSVFLNQILELKASHCQVNENIDYFLPFFDTPVMGENRWFLLSCLNTNFICFSIIEREKLFLYKEVKLCLKKLTDLNFS